MIQNGINAHSNNMLDLGLQAYKNAEAGVNKSALNIAQQNLSNGSNNSLNSDVVSLAASELQAKASAQVISRANDMLGSIIDIYV